MICNWQQPDLAYLSGDQVRLGLRRSIPCDGCVSFGTVRPANGFNRSLGLALSSSAFFHPLKLDRASLTVLFNFRNLVYESDLLSTFLALQNDQFGGPQTCCVRILRLRFGRTVLQTHFRVCNSSADSSSSCLGKP